MMTMILTCFNRPYTRSDCRAVSPTGRL